MSNGFEIHNKPNNDWEEILESVQSLIADQGRLIEQLNHVVPLKESNGNEFSNSKIQETSSSDVGTLQLHNEINSVEQTWANYENEDLDYLNSEILKEQLRRFEASLTPIGRQELDNRIQVLSKQYQSGQVSGLEEIAKIINFDFLTNDIESLTPRALKFRDEILESFKQTSLIHMHGEFTGP